MKIHESITIELLMGACERRSNSALENLGFCIYCGAESYECEPDARECICDECDEPGVYGAEELLIMISG